MPRRPALRIPLADLQSVRVALFDVKRFTGNALAVELDENPVTLWSWFGRRGLEPHPALRIADILENWSAEMKLHAVRLRELAAETGESQTETDQEESEPSDNSDGLTEMPFTQIDTDLAPLFPTAAAVNRALRALVSMTTVQAEIADLLGKSDS